MRDSTASLAIGLALSVGLNIYLWRHVHRFIEDAEVDYRANFASGPVPPLTFWQRWIP